MGFFSKMIAGGSKKNGKSSDRRIEGYIEACGSIYNLCVSKYPDMDPHEHLVIVLCTIWTKSGVFKETEIIKPAQAREIVAYTLFPACLPPEQRARVLAYKLIMEEKELSSRISTGYPEYYREYSDASKSIWDAKRNGSLEDLYSRYNKNKLHQMMLFHQNTNSKETQYSEKQNKTYAQGNIVSEVIRMIGQVSKTVTQQSMTLCI
ncbi:MAG: hypothetical protein HON76_03065 [Candidatus Scalindua sp.]|jgi:hypothetical protein|nr:hypothetical protein [Candidatus Scalindua sp.]MBT5305653.1 hypothetical protein [Candidatus Scalindua sp.]MBT6048864.1 hypothetical protein [Candidatus Scalindua sp.]MBT6229877.1 hypothetical protein [Candidatus Scalindua sp.]MBT6561493.1 hypothetical protein [Candidatus Scalindua sp.]